MPILSLVLLIDNLPFKIDKNPMLLIPIPPGL